MTTEWNQFVDVMVGVTASWMPFDPAARRAPSHVDSAICFSEDADVKRTSARFRAWRAAKVNQCRADVPMACLV